MKPDQFSRDLVANSLQLIVLSFSIQLTCFAPLEVQAQAQNQESDQGIHYAFNSKIKAASKGQATDANSIEDKLIEAIEQQIELFVESAVDGTEAARAVAKNIGDSMELREALLAMLTYELSIEPISDMESMSHRGTLDDLGIQIAWDYSVVAGELAEEKQTVRIRLPELHVCGGCKAALEHALNGVEGFENVTCDLKTMTAQFLAPVDCDVEEILNGLESGGTGQLAKWKLVRNE